MRTFFRNNGLSIVMLALFAVFLVGQSVAGFFHFNEEQREHQEAEIGYGAYLRSGEFLESVFENWESEFLQMAAFVYLAGILRQRGSAESKGFEEDEANADPAKSKKPDSPGPVHRGGLLLKLYSHSLSLSLLALFVFSFAMHAVSGWKDYNEEAQAHGQAAMSLWGFLGSATFWFQSFQNWQSEFLAVAAIVLLSIVLRERRSSQSKPVHEAHSATGK
jgi:hypothetical protein